MLDRIIESSSSKISILSGKTVVVTGATGMLGSCFIDALVLWNHQQNTSSKIRIICVSRNETTAQKRFHYCWDSNDISYIRQDVSEEIRDFPMHVDYIIHAASNGDPVNFSRNPTETLLANVLGCHHLLNYGLYHGMKRFLYVSSGEIYGDPDQSGVSFSEDYSGPVDFSTSRACYPEGKRAAEVLCQCYLQQYQVDSVIVRPCHLFGPTMTRSDSRAVSQFLWNAVNDENIVLKSAGNVERSHCYIEDAVTALFYVLKDGISGKAYNIADSRYQMTIRQFAQQVAQFGKTKIVFENPSEIERKGYSQRKRSVLDASLLRALGWVPQSRDNSAIMETIAILKEAL